MNTNECLDAAKEFIGAKEILSENLFTGFLIINIDRVQRYAKKNNIPQQEELNEFLSSFKLLIELGVNHLNLNIDSIYESVLKKQAFIFTEPVEASFRTIFSQSEFMQGVASLSAKHTLVSDEVCIELIAKYVSFQEKMNNSKNSVRKRRAFEIRNIADVYSSLDHLRFMGKCYLLDSMACESVRYIDRVEEERGGLFLLKSVIELIINSDNGEFLDEIYKGNPGNKFIYSAIKNSAACLILLERMSK